MGEDRLGALRAGRLADITVLGEDPVECPADELIGVGALLTVVGGEVVFRSSALSS